MSEEPLCRVCGNRGVTARGVVEYLVGYAWTVYDCRYCGCRFTRHDGAIYEQLHESGAISYYHDYRRVWAEAKRRFDAGDVDGLRSFLSEWSKYRFVMDEVDATPADAHLLEVGASRGYLTSYFILKGRDVLGVDVASDAVESASAAFGDRFALLQSLPAESKASYDVIYHVGMIGCVEDPIALTKRLLAMLKPGGRLLFNAPNRAACRMKGQLWLDSAPPPDLVTLYPPGFWRKQFQEFAKVEEVVELNNPEQSFLLALRRFRRRSWRAPVPQEMKRRDGAPASPLGERDGGGAWHWVERGAGKLGQVTRLSRLIPSWPTEFGLFVKMRVP